MLVGSLASITEPVVAFVRLAQGIIMPSALEVPVPVRLAAFLKIVYSPKLRILAPFILKYRMNYNSM